MPPSRILVATDGSSYAEAAVETALQLAARFSSSLLLVSVVDVRQLEGPFLSDLSGLAGMAPYLNLQSQLREALLQKARAVLDSLAGLCAARGVSVETHLEEGVVSRVICRAGRTCDLICLGRHGEHASFRGFLMGSTVEEVVRGSSRPVLVTTAAGGPPPARILVPYDGSQPASAALGLALEMASSLPASLAVLSISGEPAGAESLLAEARRFIGNRAPGTEYLQRPGEPVTGILETVAERGADLVVMGAWGHSRLRELLLGSVTAGVLAGSTVPVLLYR